MAATCSYCDTEMGQGIQTLGGIDTDVTEEAIRLYADELRDCRDCGVQPGANHHPGCDTERCPRCGGQAIGCNCIYVVNGYNMDTLEEEHPAIYNGGPTAEMYTKWNAEWGGKRLRWTGLWPGKAECRKLGWMCRDMDGQGNVVTFQEALDIRGRGGRVLWHQPCEPGDEGASADLNRWAREGCPTGDALDALLAGRVRT
jgi:hypothetical protein